ncbi:unnamed protein product, partial [Tetraodon nigroviridis]
VLGALERLQTKLVQREEWSHSGAVGTLRQTLQSPLLSHILTLQQSIRQLRNQLTLMPPDSCDEFSFSSSGQLIMSAVSASSRPAVHAVAGSASTLTNGSSPPARQSPPSQEHLQRWILAAAKGRHTELVRLTRPVSGGLGFSVVGLSPTGGGSSQGVFVKQVQPGGVAHRVRVRPPAAPPLHRDGGLQERDQILAINGVPLEAGVSQPQALALLQQPGELVELVVARERPLRTVSRRFSSVASQNVKRCCFCSHLLGKDEWGHVEEIRLPNDGSGLGFGIVGGRSTGVVVRTLVPNSVADRDGRLRTGDHILRIGATPTSGLTSDQVVKVLQECGSHVTMLVAREPRGSHLAVPQLPHCACVCVWCVCVCVCVCVRAAQPNLEGYEIHEVPLVKKDGQSLGISIIGHNPLSSQDAVGVFVKHVVPGSAADQSGNIRIQDRLIALDGVSLHGLTNQEVVKVMKRTGQTVVLTLVRKKTRGPERVIWMGRWRGAGEEPAVFKPAQALICSTSTLLDQSMVSSCTESPVARWCPSSKKHLHPSPWSAADALTSDLEPESETESEPEPAPKPGPGFMRTSQPMTKTTKKGSWLCGPQMFMCWSSRRSQTGVLASASWTTR